MTETTATPRRGRRRILAAGAGVLVAFLLAEIAFRVLGLGAPPGAKCLLAKRGDFTIEYHCYPSNPSGEFRPVPDMSKGWHLLKLFSPPVELPLTELRDTPWCVEYRRENQGIRGPAVTPNPAPGVVRIAGVGDSFGLGEGVPFEKTLFAHLAKFLGPRYEALNFGVSGIGTADELRVIDWMVPRYRCSRALVIFNLNDVDFAPEIRQRMGEVYDLVNLRAAQIVTDDRPWYRHASRLVEFCASAMEVRRITRETESSYLDAYDPAKNGERLTLLEAQLGALARSTECKVGLVVYPMMYRLDDYPLQPCHDRVVALARSAGLPVLDLAPAFDGEDAEALQVHPIDHHPNGRAHEIAARAIADWIATQPTLR